MRDLIGVDWYGSLERLSMHRVLATGLWGVCVLLMFSILPEAGISSEKDSTAMRAQPVKRIYLMPFGDVPQELLTGLADSLEPIFSQRCVVSEATPLPPNSYDSRRDQYLSTPFLKSLGSRVPKDGERVLGVADVDLYTPGLNFIFGQAYPNGRICLISVTRLRQSFYGLPEDQEVFNLRVLKEAVHELGHTYGLDHCSDPKCVMFFSNSLLDTDHKGKDFCGKCRRLLVEKGVLRSVESQ